MNISNLVTYHARTRPGAVAVITNDRTHSFAALDRLVSHAAARLSKLGIAPGDVVGTAFPGNGLPHLVAILALARVGAVSVPIRYGTGPGASREIAARFGVKAVVAPTAKAAVGGTELITVDRSWMEAPADARFDAVSGRGDEPWRLMLTSGTTGAPKCIAETHAQTMEHVLFYQTTGLCPAGSRLLCYMTFDIAFGLHTCLRYLLNGRTAVLAMEKENTGFFDLLNLTGITHLYLSPYVLQSYFKDTPEGSVRRAEALHLMIGGGTAPEPLLREVQRKLTRHVYAAYGTSEIGMLAFADPETLERYPGTLGRAVPWIEAGVVDDSDVPVPPGKPGMLRFRGIGLPQAYYRDPEATAAKFRGGWYYSGDLGAISADGLIFFESRTDEVMNVGGAKVPPGNIERILTSHPDVLEAAAFAASFADGWTAVHAAVVARGNFDEPALLEFCRQHLGALAPERVHSVSVLPRDSEGKLRRRELTQQFSRAAGTPDTGTAEEN
jgi:fatty-acyl-CoA synthase